MQRWPAPAGRYPCRRHTAGTARRLHLGPLVERRPPLRAEVGEGVYRERSTAAHPRDPKNRLFSFPLHICLLDSPCSMSCCSGVRRWSGVIVDSGLLIDEVALGLIAEQGSLPLARRSTPLARASSAAPDTPVLYLMRAYRYFLHEPNSPHHRLRIVE